MSAIAKIHVAKTQLGLDDDSYRAILIRATGKTSSAEMNPVEHAAVLREFNRLGFRDKARNTAGVASGKYAPVLKALWLSAWNLGVARSKEDKALIAFVQRQTGLSHTRFLTDEEDARKAIEGLKGWIAREAGVKWPARGDVFAIKRAILDAQWRRLIALGDFKPITGTPDPMSELMFYAARVVRQNQPWETMTAGDYDDVQQALGKRIRGVLARANGSTRS